jgi:hypothetical protein
MLRRTGGIDMILFLLEEFRIVDTRNVRPPIVRWRA